MCILDTNSYYFNLITNAFLTSVPTLLKIVVIGIWRLLAEGQLWDEFQYRFIGRQTKIGIIFLC